MWIRPIFTIIPSIRDIFSKLVSLESFLTRDHVQLMTSQSQFVKDYTPSLSKLTHHALKGVFFGYSRMQKGYRVYFPDTWHYITFADVTFHEDVPYFSSSTTPLRASISLPWFSLYSSLLLVAFSRDLYCTVYYASYLSYLL